MRKVKRLRSNCSKIIIIGTTSFNIQGVNLRETIEGIVKNRNLDVRGKVLNMKDGSVVVICTGSDAKKLFGSIKRLQSEEEYQFKNLVMRDFYTDEVFDDFRVERADDQTEMVLALKGAGYRFQKSTETLHDIHEDLIKRDKRLEGARLLTLHHELVYNLEQLANPSDTRRIISIIALTTNIQFPPTLVPSIVFPINTALISLQELRDDEELYNNSQRISQLKADLESLDRKVVAALRQRYDLKRV